MKTINDITPEEWDAIPWACDNSVVDDLAPYRAQCAAELRRITESGAPDLIRMKVVERAHFNLDAGNYDALNYDILLLRNEAYY